MQNIHNQVVHPRGSFLSEEELHQGAKQVLNNFRAIRHIQKEPTSDRRRVQSLVHIVNSALQLELFE